MADSVLELVESLCGPDHEDLFFEERDEIIAKYAQSLGWDLFRIYPGWCLSKGNHLVLCDTMRDVCLKILEN